MTDRGEYISTESIAPGVKVIIEISKEVRISIFDYALGAAILGLIPIYGRWIPEIRLTLLSLLNLKMIVNVGRFWGYHKSQRKLAIAGFVFGIVGSFALAIMAWLTVFAIGLFLPLIDSFARPIGYGVLTWNIGNAVSRYYYDPRIPNMKALQKAIDFRDRK